jgi:hypothetical protein
MQIPDLVPHGERIRIEYAVLHGETGGGVGRSTDADRKSGTGDIVTRYIKGTSASSRACALGWIKNVHEHAIEYTNQTKELRGLAFFWAIFGGLGMAPVFVGGGIFGISIGGFKDIVLWIMGSIAVCGGLAFGLYMLTFVVRLDLFRPSDLPIIFDRKNRRIYRLMREEKPGLRGGLQPWPLLACQYEWDLVDAEHHKQVFTNGGTIATNHFLIFLVRKSPDDPTIIDSFQIGNAGSLNDELTDGMWEHIRRFMEEGGPHLPSPDEPLADMTPPLSWWESMGAVGPFGSNYFKFWRDAPLYTLFMHLISPAVFPMFFLWGTGNYLSYRTEFSVQWPTEVLAAVGSDTTL